MILLKSVDNIHFQERPHKTAESVIYEKKIITVINCCCPGDHGGRLWKLEAKEF